MQATYIRPRTAPASPERERPGTAYSTRLTIRQVEPSPESLSDAFANGFAHGDTPALGSSSEPFPPFDRSSNEDAATDEEANTHIPSTEPTAAAEAGAGSGALRRGGTPSGRSSPRKSRSWSPQKSRSASPRKHLVRTPSLSVHQESPSSTYSATSTYSAVGDGKWEAPDTPSPVPREQQRHAYAPLQVRRPFADSNSESEPVEELETHARIAGYMQKQQRQHRGGRAKAAETDRARVGVLGPVKRVVGPPTPHIVQAMAQPHTASQALPPFSAAQRQAGKEPVRQASVSRQSEASGASVASKHSVFSTPGRDEMERKKPIVEEDEGPFAKARSMADLEQRRRRVSGGTNDGEEKDEKKRPCGMRCVVM